METIFEEQIENYLKTQPKTLMKTNLEFNKLGIKKVLGNVSIEINTYYKELTFIENLNGSNTKKIPKKLRDELEKLNGFGNESLYYITIPNGVEVIKHKGVELGFYSREKNFICMFYNFISQTNTNVGEKNEVIGYILDILKEFHKKTPFETKDVQEIGRKIVAEQFNKVWIEKRENNIRNVTTSFENINMAQKNIVNNYKQITLMTKENEIIKENLDKGMEKVESTIKKLEQSKFLKSVKIENGEIIIDYGDIYITWNKKKIYMGDYYAKFRSNGLQIINRKPIHYDDSILHHPHINGNEGNDICFGSGRSTEITKLMSELNYEKIAYMVLLFLKNYNPDSEFYNIKYWEKAKEIDGERIYK